MRYVDVIDRQIMITMNQSGLSDAEIARRLGCCRPLVSRYLRRVGYDRVPQQRIYTLNGKFFETIETPEQAYWLGFILADGCIDFGGSNPRALLIKLSHRDSAHLSLMSGDLNYDGPIHERVDSIRSGKYAGKKYRKVVLAISSSELCRDLIRHGWMEFKKAGNVSILQIVPENLISHTMRGLFDGDGCFTMSTRGPKFIFCDQHLAVVAWYRDKLIDKLGLKENSISPHKKKKAYRFQYDGAQVGSIMEYLYSARGPSLDRKKSLFRLWERQ